MIATSTAISPSFIVPPPFVYEPPKIVEIPVFDPKPVSYAVKCECVRWLRLALDINIRGDAWRHKPNVPLSDAKIGDVLLLQYADVSHVAVITETQDGKFKIKESNFRRCQEGTRTVARTDYHIKGIYRPSA